VVRVGAFYCVGFLLIVNEKPETSGFSLFIRPAGGSPAGEFFLLVRFDAIRRLSFFGLDGRFPRVWSRLVSWAPNSGQGPAKISYGGRGAGKGLRVR
jgi:hypothetical protein